jgi:hypothetical protein
MDCFIGNCLLNKPNITYVAIGSAYSAHGGPQQHPPFIEKLMVKHPEFSFEIVLIDPLIENPPEIVKHYGLSLNENGHYSKNNLQVSVIREKFYYEINANNYVDTINSKNLLYSLINRTINLKNENPTNTFILFVHDFSGYEISKLSDLFWQEYKEKDDVVKYLYQKNILIDINNKIDEGCYVDLKSIYFHPELIIGSGGGYEIFNPFYLNDFDIYTLSVQKYNSTNIKQLIIHALMCRLTNFSKNILPYYRQQRIIYEKNIVMTKKITNEIFSQLKLITSFLDFFPNTKIAEEIFAEFNNFCNKNILENPYDIIQKFDICKEKLKVFILDLDPINYNLHLNDLAIEYVVTNKKLPLFIELLLQHK